MQKAILTFLICIICCGLFAADNHQFNCYSIIVGKNASEDGAVLLAHNEDDRGNLSLNVYRMPSQQNRKADAIFINPAFSLPQTKANVGFIWFEFPEQEFADCFFNENGVVIASNSCLSREDKPELTSGGIGYMLRYLIAERAKSARDAVQIAAELIDQYGYHASGRSYVFADKTEGWLMHVVKGKHWVARRIADNEVAVIANYYTMGAIDLKDKSNTHASTDIIDYAIKRGWYNAEKDGDFDFARVYSDPNNLKSMGNILRQWRGTTILSGKNFKIDERLPFSFKPRKLVRIQDLFKLLRDHFEGTEYDITNKYRLGSPNPSPKRTICHESTQLSFVAQLRGNMPSELANIAWVAFRRPDSNAYTPWYFSIAEVPDNYSHGNVLHALKNHFSSPPASDNTQNAFNDYCRLSECVDQHYAERIDRVQKTWKTYESYVFSEIKRKEDEFKYMLQLNKNLAAKLISNYVHYLEYRKWFIASELLQELQK